MKRLGFLLFAMALLGQEPRLKLDFTQDPCGNPLAENQAYLVTKGRVLKVLSGDTLIIRFPKGGVKRVHLPCLAVPQIGEQGFEASRAGLVKLLGGKREVEVFLSWSGLPKAESFFAMVGSFDWTEIQIANGLGRFVPGAGYEMGSYSKCRCQLAEQKAKDQRLGVWALTNP